MKRILLLLSLFTLVLATSPRAQDAKRRIDAPVFKVGEEWRYRKQNIGGPGQPSEFSERVEQVGEAEVWVLGKGADNRQYWRLLEAKSARPLARYEYNINTPGQRGDKTADDAANAPEVQFPMEIGKTYKIEESWINSSGGRGTSDLKATITAFEKVKVAAGEYGAFKIEISGWWNGRSFTGSGRQQRTVWYAPELKQTIKREHRDYYDGQLSNHAVTEMIEFKPAPP